MKKQEVMILSKRKRSSGIALPVFVTVAATLASFVLIVYMVLSGNGVNSNPVTQTVNREVTRKAVETVIQKETGTDITINEIKEQMSEEDAEELDDIINKYADDGIISEALEIYKTNNGDAQATADALKDKVSEKDMIRMYELYSKYGEDVLDK